MHLLREDNSLGYYMYIGYAGAHVLREDESLGYDVHRICWSACAEGDIVPIGQVSDMLISCEIYAGLHEYVL